MSRYEPGQRDCVLPFAVTVQRVAVQAAQGRELVDVLGLLDDLDALDVLPGYFLAKGALTHRGVFKTLLEFVGLECDKQPGLPRFEDTLHPMGEGYRVRGRLSSCVYTPGVKTNSARQAKGRAPSRGPMNPTAGSGPGSDSKFDCTGKGRWPQELWTITFRSVRPRRPARASDEASLRSLASMYGAPVDT